VWNKKDLINAESMAVGMVQPTTQRKSHGLIPVAGEQMAPELCVLIPG
jgi:hypothetical protein